MNHQINIGFETGVEDEQSVRELIRTCALRVLESEKVPFDAEIDVTVVDADTIREMNAEYRDKDTVTDVLSFPMYEFLNGEPQEELEREPDSGCVMLGDMILCYTRACEPKPRRVRNIFICSGVVFCASSRMMKLSSSVRPRI